MLDAAVRGYPDESIGFHVVWTAMMAGDTEATAIQTGRMFDDPRVKQYWDPNRLAGTAYSAKVYPGYLIDMEKGMEAGLPEDHWWHQQERDWQNKKPEQAPLWDVVFTYGKNAQWGKSPPSPRDMIKQVLFYGGSSGPTGLFFSDFKKPVRNGDWGTELTTAMTSMVGRKPATSVANSQPTSAVIPGAEPGCHEGNVQARMLAFKFDGLKDSQIERVEQAVAAMQGVMRASFDPDLKTLAVLAEFNSEATAERIVQYLDLAGYKSREASEEELNAAITSMQSNEAIVIRRDFDSVVGENTSFPDTHAGRVAQAFIKAFNSGDENAVRQFSETHRSKSSLESRAMEERLGQYRQLYSDMGNLTLHSVEPHDDWNITVTVRPERTFSALALTFECESDSPNKLEEIRIMPTFIEGGFDAEADEEFDESKMGKLTHLTESLQPLREHFNANKGKHRFIAILSPT